MICFSWLGFPQYGARCVRAFVRSTNEKVVVIASRPDVPVKGMEEISECDVHWVGLNDCITLKELLGEIPRVLTVPGWKFPLFNRFRDEVRANGGKVISAIDNNYVVSLKEIVKGISVRLIYEKKYDGFWVPSVSGHKLMRFYGIPEEKIFTGLYSVDNTLFRNGAPLPERDKRLLFVGQFIDRKNVLRLCQAFLKADEIVGQGWKLEMCGCGPLKAALPNNPSIIVHDFVQPEEVAGLYQKARAFIIPSKEDHWPLVMHEAVLSGCLLLTSNRCGDMFDFLDEGINGCSFSPFSTNQMIDAIVRTMQMSDDELLVAQQRSLELGHRISLQTFVDSVKKFT